MSTSTLPFPRRIVVSNASLPEQYKDIQNAEPAVKVITEEITPLPLLDGHAAQCPIFTHKSVPTSNNILSVPLRFCAFSIVELIKFSQFTQIYQPPISRSSGIPEPPRS